VADGGTEDSVTIVRVPVAPVDYGIPYGGVQDGIPYGGVQDGIPYGGVQDGSLKARTACKMGLSRRGCQWQR